MRVGVIGARGRMGEVICRALDESAHDLVARIGRGDDLRVLVDVDAELIVDVTHAEAARQTLSWAALHAMHAVVGTTGFDGDDLSRLNDEFERVGRTCFMVPNFSIGAVLMMRFAAQAAAYFDGIEIVELHHDKKRDAPSGTAMLTAAKIIEARTEALPAESESHTDALGARGADIGGVRVHSVRLPGLLAHQEVLLGARGQTLTIRHDSFDRQAFMPGVVKAIDGIGSLPAGIVTGLEAVL